MISYTLRKFGHSGVRVIAVFEALKGALVLVVAAALLDSLSRDLEKGAEELVRHFHFNPASRYPRIFVDAANYMGDGRLLLLSAGAITYATIRFAEAYGLWHDRAWARILGIVSAAVYIPFEIVGLAHRVTWLGLFILIVNVLIVAILWIEQRNVQAAR